MQIPGHLAVAVAESNLPMFQRGPRRLLIPLFLASLFPDIVDKSIGYIFHAMPNGRHFAHNLFSLLGLSLLAGLIFGPAGGWAWFCGHLGHLLADSGRMVPWFFPLKKYPFQKGRLKFDPIQLLQETVILLLVLIFSRKRDFFHKRD
ncbi:MAG: metal-dependent hydrolase [Anaerolineales bacterium]|nr:metal-dependent hydrolase [Anaerolineales bacterium]